MRAATAATLTLPHTPTPTPTPPLYPYPSTPTLLTLPLPLPLTGLFSLGCVAALTFVQCCLPETKGALAASEPHAPHAPHSPRVGPPTCHVLMGRDLDGGSGGGARRSRASDSPGALSGRASSVDSDDVEWPGAVRSSVDPRTRRPLAMH